MDMLMLHSSSHLNQHYLTACGKLRYAVAFLRTVF